MRLLNPPLKLSAEILSFVYHCDIRKKSCTVESILKYFNKTKSYVLDGVDFLVAAKILIRENDTVSVSGQYINKLDGTQEQSAILIKNALIDYKPFVEYTYFLGQNKTPQQSARLIRTIYSLESNEQSIIAVFSAWIKYLRIKVDQKAISQEALQLLIQSSEDRLKANKFVKDEFGPLYSSIPTVVLEDLTSAILNISKDPASSLNEAGRALEDYFRIGIAKDIDLTGCNGIVQIANELNKLPDFPTKLNNISSCLGNMRSMGDAHGVDKKIKERWRITSTAATAYVMLIILTMKSYLEYQSNKSLVF